VQVTLPASDFSYLRNNSLFASDVGKLVDDLAERQGWQSMYFFIFCSFPTMERLSHDMFGLSATAFFPSYLPPELSPSLSDGINETACSIQVSCHCFSHYRESASGTIFVPQKHQAMIDSLYKNLGVKKVFGDPGKRSTGISGELLPAEGRAVERHFFRKAGIEQYFLHPSLVSSSDLLSKLEESPSETAQYIFLDMLDSKCPALCEELESEGFLFSGILPFVHGRESIAYLRGRDKRCTWLDYTPYHADARELKDYIDATESDISIQQGPEKDPSPSSLNEYNSLDN